MARSRRRPDCKKQHDFIACSATVPDEHSSIDRRRCRCAANNGDFLCGVHRRAMNRMLKPDRPYFIKLQFKPCRKNKDGSYRDTVIAKPFKSIDEANEYMSLTWGLISRERKGKRLRSASVGRVKGMR